MNDVSKEISPQNKMNIEIKSLRIFVHIMHQIKRESKGPIRQCLCYEGIAQFTHLFGFVDMLVISLYYAFTG